MVDEEKMKLGHWFGSMLQQPLKLKNNLCSLPSYSVPEEVEVENRGHPVNPSLHGKWLLQQK